MIVGAYSPEGAPSWMSAGMLADYSWAAMREAAERSRETGFRWIATIGYDHPIGTPMGPVAAAFREAAEEAGLWPYIHGIAFREEWWEMLHSNQLKEPLAEHGLTVDLRSDADIYRVVPKVRDWLSAQHEAIAEATGKPVVWVTTFAHYGRQYGAWYYRPIPDGTSLVAIDAYVHAGGSFDVHVAPALLASEAATTLPLILVGQGFRATGPKQDALWLDGPSPEDITKYVHWARRPRWVALLWFTWASRPYADIVGLADMSEHRAALEQALGVTS